MPNNDSHQHVVKTSEQWNERIVEFWVVPRGCLCVELTPNGKTKIKIGEGNKYYSQLPYICDGDDLSQYYTKEEVNNLFDNFNRMAIMSTDEYDRKADLPMTGNKLGDVRFVKSSSPSITIDPDIYLWNGRKWIYVGNQFPKIDLNKYLKKTEFHELFDPVKERVDDIGPKVDEMYPMRHTHANKDILDNTTASYTSEEKTKLAGLHNYDVEISDLQSKSHTHDNKSFLDTITQEYQIWSQEDRYKFDHIKNYDQDITEIRVYIQTLESIAHTHANKNILDQVTAAFTVEDKTKIDSLHNDTPFIGTDGMYPGVEGNVPAPLTTDVGKFLSSDGTWRPISEASDFIGATDERDGYHGLVPAPLAGEESYFLKGDGTWSEVPEYELPPATTTTLGGIIVGDNLTIDEDGVLDGTPDTTYTAGDGVTLGTPYVHNRNTDIPETYLQLEYLESTGTQYINFNSLAIDNYVQITIDFSITHVVDDTWIAGNGNSWYGYYRGLGMLNGSLRKQDANVTYDPDILQENLRVVGTFSVDESYQHVYAFARSGSNGTVAGNSQCRIYEISSIETYSDYSPKPGGRTTHMYPCMRKSDNVPGLYDTDRNIFYTNDGTGDFICGPEDTVTEYINPTVINVNTGAGLEVDADNDINVKLGSGLYFDSNGNIAASGGGGGGTIYQAGDGINITSGATPSIEAKLGEGLHFDTNDAIAADVYAAGQGISMSNPSGISVLNQEYYFDTQVTCSLSGSFQRSFQKTTNEPALGALINVHNVGQSDSWTGPVFVGLTESSVKCTYNTDNVIGPFTYKGKTWYCTGANWWVDGSLTDDNHNILRIPGQNQSVFPDEINDFTIAKLIIDTAGLLDNNDKVITAKLGSGLTFDDNNAIELDDAIKIRLNCNNEPD